MLGNSKLYFSTILFHFNIVVLDIDECEENPCHHMCFNSEGSYSCSCRISYIIQLDGHTCLGTGILHYTYIQSIILRKKRK